MYRALDPSAILATCGRLGQRIAERFPGSGLSRVSQELFHLAEESAAHVETLRRPHWPTRVGVLLGLLLIVGILVAVIVSFRVSAAVGGLSDLLQGLEAAVNDVIFLGIAIYFLLTVENRLKRRWALRSLHELRSTYVIDMHQLTKDPELLLSPQMVTASSPQRAMTRFELSRYLDYCSEMLSIISKLAALYVQHFEDGLVLSAVNDIESLTGSLSAKIWQKIVILDSFAVLEMTPPAQ
jgi:hypothetical protein